MSYEAMMFNSLQDGDILLEKSNTFLGNMVGNCIWKMGDTPLKWHMPHVPKRPSNHNAIFGFNESHVPVIFEMLSNGLVQTPISHYAKLVETKTSELKFARLKNISFDNQSDLICWCIKNLGTGYDYFSYIGFIMKIFLDSKLNIQMKEKFTCTEMVKHDYKSIEKDFLASSSMPTSLDVENKIIQGELDIVLELYNL